MQSRPEAPDLLDAIQDLLIKEILPRLEGDSLLAYKTLVSWNMLGVVSRELRMSEGHLKEEARSVAAVLGSPPPGEMSSDALRAFVRGANERLVQEIRKTKAGPENKAILEHVKRTLASDLSVSNPRFAAGTGEG